MKDMDEPLRLELEELIPRINTLTAQKDEIVKELSKLISMANSIKDARRALAELSYAREK